MFLGMLLGATSLAVLSDKYGRRKVIIGGVICTCLFGILSGFAPNLGWMCFFRFGVGFFMTVGSVAFTLFAELIPTEKDPMDSNKKRSSSNLLTRGKLLILQGIFWSCGALFNVFLAWIVLSFLDWRWYLVLSSVPLMLASIGSFYIPESPHWLIVSGQYEEATNLLRAIAETNGSANRLPNGWMLQQLENNKIENNKRGNICNLFASKRRDTTIILNVIYSCCVFAYYGISFISVRYFDRLDEIEKNGTAIYWEMLITTFAEIPALIFGILLIDRLGRRGLMNVAFFAFSICSYVLVIHKFQRIRDLGIALVFTGRMFINLGFTGLAIYFVEYYPTYIRATALGLAISLGRFAGIVTTFTAESMSITLGLYLYGTSGLIAFIASILIARDTMNKRLDVHDKSFQHLPDTQLQGV